MNARTLSYGKPPNASNRQGCARNSRSLPFSFSGAGHDWRFFFGSRHFELDGTDQEVSRSGGESFESIGDFLLFLLGLFASMFTVRYTTGYQTLPLSCLPVSEVRCLLFCPCMRFYFLILVFWHFEFQFTIFLALFFEFSFFPHVRF